MGYGRDRFEHKQTELTRKYQNDQIESVGEMYIRENKSAKEIGEELGLSVSTVRKYIKLGGFQKRGY